MIKSVDTSAVFSFYVSSDVALQVILVIMLVEDHAIHCCYLFVFTAPLSPPPPHPPPPNPGTTAGGQAAGLHPCLRQHRATARSCRPALRTLRGGLAVHTRPGGGHPLPHALRRSWSGGVQLGRMAYLCRKGVCGNVCIVLLPCNNAAPPHMQPPALLSVLLQYRDLSHTSQLAVTVWQVREGDASATALAGATMRLFSKKGRLKTGPQLLRMWLGQEADTAWPSCTPGKVPVAQRGELG